jgi:hypothetical protein
VLLGDSESNPARLASDIVIDRCYVHGDPKAGSRRGVALNSRATAIVDSWFEDFKEAGADSQAIAGWNGPGPYAIVNNHLEAAGENIIFGGSPPAIEGLVPSDITIRRNHLYKPLSWKEGGPGYEGTPWTIKNLFELKNARRVLFESNLLENNWVHGQNGFAVLLTVRTERDAAPWAVVEDVTLLGNVLRHSAAGINILGIDDTSPSGRGRTTNVVIAHNLFVDVGAKDLGGSGTLFQILNGASGVTIDHNTAFHTGSIISADMRPSSGLVFRNNIVQQNEYGVFGSGAGTGLPALRRYFPGVEFQKNAIVGARGGYPKDNRYPKTLAEVGFRNLAKGDYRLASPSGLRGAGTDGADLGADMDRVAPALQMARAARRQDGSGQADANDHE